MPHRRRVRVQRDGRPRFYEGLPLPRRTLGAKYETAEVPADLLEQCKKMRTALLEELATVDESNEDFMMKVLENPASLTEEEIHAVIRKGVITNKFNPVLCGTAFKNKGDTASSRCGRPLDALSSRPRHHQRCECGYRRTDGAPT